VRNTSEMCCVHTKQSKHHADLYGLCIIRSGDMYLKVPTNVAHMAAMCAASRVRVAALVGCGMSCVPPKTHQ